jgi:hypothetical protein
LIGGDSWGLGELQEILSNTGQYYHKITHGGLEQYLTELGYTVINSSMGGASNKFSIDLLEHSLDTNYNDGDLVLWIKTDPTRNFGNHSLDDLVREKILLEDYSGIKHDFTQTIKQSGGLLNALKDISTADYSRLNDLAEQYHTKIYLIGGHCPIYTELADKFTSLEVVTESWVELALSDFVEYQGQFRKWLLPFPRPLTSLAYIELSSLDEAVAVSVIDELNQMESAYQMLREDVWTNDKVHLNRQAHKILFDFVVTKFNLTKNK